MKKTAEIFFKYICIFFILCFVVVYTVLWTMLYMYQHTNIETLKPKSYTNTESVKNDAPTTKKQTSKPIEEKVTPKSDVNVPEIG